MKLQNITYAAGIVACLTTSGLAQEAEAPPPILFTNANVFDGFSPDLIEGANVLVEGNVITQVSTDPIDAPDAFVVDVEGKTMTITCELDGKKAAQCIKLLEFLEEQDDAQNVWANLEVADDALESSAG